MHITIMAWMMSIIGFFACIAPTGLQPRLMKAQFAILSNPVAGFETNSLLVWRDGEIIHEAYFNCFDENALQPVHAITRSVLKSLVGIAIEEGYIESIHQRITDFFPDVAIVPGQESKRDMTVEHLLTMTSGLDAPWDDPVWNAPGLGAAIFALPQETAPGEVAGGFRRFYSATMELLVLCSPAQPVQVCWILPTSTCLARLALPTQLGNKALTAPTAAPLG